MFEVGCLQHAGEDGRRLMDVGRDPLGGIERTSLRRVEAGRHALKGMSIHGVWAVTQDGEGCEGTP